MLPAREMCHDCARITANIAQYTQIWWLLFISNNQFQQVFQPDVCYICHFINFLLNFRHLFYFILKTRRNRFTGCNIHDNWFVLLPPNSFSICCFCCAWIIVVLWMKCMDACKKECECLENCMNVCWCVRSNQCTYWFVRWNIYWIICKLHSKTK